MKPIYTKLVNGRIITPGGIIPNGQLLLSGNKILEISDKNIDVDNVQIIDAGGNYIAPGCIDIHIHGGGGHDFMEGTEEAFHTIARTHAQYGITALYPTIAVSSRETFDKAIQTCEKVMKQPHQGASFMGLHLEGNYINPVMKGGQDPNFLSLPDPDEYKEIVARTKCIKRWSASPELEGALAFGKYISAHGILPSLAHTVADYPLTKAAFDAGYTHVTHFYNAMTGVHKEREFKHEGTIESIYLIDDMTVELVCDGIHVPPAILKLVYKLKGPERIALVTDAMFAAGYLGNIADITDRLIIEDGVCKLADRSALASSIATGNRLIRTMINDAEVPLVDAIRMASETPARIMGIDDKKGTLQKGKDADIFIFDNEINILATFVEGNIVYRA